ncbi:MAG: HAMP domain-containing histidine kinase [Candidatus Omnitrophica bacterium]|nr:HAMP domain-containing histidine kinase [Candidatus Omnitrophota bacterium]
MKKNNFTNYRPMSIRIKIILIFFLILLFFLLTFIFNIYSFKELTKEQKLISLADRIVEDFLQVRRHEKNFFLRGTGEWAEMAKMRLTAFQRELGIYKKIAHHKEELDLIGQIEEKTRAYNDILNNVIDVYPNNLENSEPENLINIAREIGKLSQQLREDAENNFALSIQKIKQMQLFGFIIAVFIAMLAYFFASRTIITPINKLQKLSKMLSKGKVLSCQDIKILETQFRGIDFKDEIGELTRAYIEMLMQWNNSCLAFENKLKETEGLYQLKSQFTSVVSHELRTPLTAIKEGIEYIVDGSAGPINAEQKEFLEIVGRNVERLSRLINYVLDFSKLASGQADMKMELAELNPILNSVIDVYQLTTKKKGVEIKRQLEASNDLKIWVDTDRLAQVLHNLISNAIKFTDTGTITVVTEKDNPANTIQICVEDTGTGIKEEDISRLFTSFTQLGDAKKRRVGGTGLGLAICKQIIERLSGKIWAESEYGKGTKFCFILPIRERREQVLRG